MTNNDWYLHHEPRRLRSLSAEQQAADLAAAEHDLWFVLGRTALTPERRILEIGCGWGRHALTLARLGFRHVRSIDITPASLQFARALASEHKLRCDFHQQDFMTVDGLSFDAVFSLYDRSCCGFPTEAEDRASLRHLASLVQRGGWLVFGINDWPFALPEPSQRWRETPEGLELYEVVPDREAMTCTDHLTVMHSDGRRERVELTRRHYYVPELKRMLGEAGFTIRFITHRLRDGCPYGTGEHGLFVFAQREER